MTAKCKRRLTNHMKLWATNCGGWDNRGADLECLVCREGKPGQAQAPDADPRKSILILLVDRKTVARNPPGAYEVVEQPETMGHTAVAGPLLRLKNFRVPKSNTLEPPGFDAAYAFCKEDNRAGKESLLQRQSVADLLTDIKMKTDACRALTWRAAEALERGQGADLALEAKIFCSDAVVPAVLDAMKVVGM
jgi:hypothetical protein